MYFPSSNTPSHKLARVSKSRVPGKTSFYSFNLLWLVWAVGGGLFITKFLLCNWLAILVKPVFEDPVDTVQVESKIPVIPIYVYSNIGRMCMSWAWFPTRTLAGTSGSRRWSRWPRPTPPWQRGWSLPRPGRSSITLHSSNSWQRIGEQIFKHFNHLLPQSIKFSIVVTVLNI